MTSILAPFTLIAPLKTLSWKQPTKATVVCLFSFRVSSHSVSEMICCDSFRQLHSFKFCLITGSSSGSDASSSGAGLCGNGLEGSGIGSTSTSGVLTSVGFAAASAFSRAAAMALRGFPLVVVVAGAMVRKWLYALQLCGLLPGT